MTSSVRSAEAPACVTCALTSFPEMNGAPAARFTLACDFTCSDTSGFCGIPARNEAVGAVFCGPPTSELFSVESAETVTSPSCDTRDAMPKPMTSMGTNTIEESHRPFGCGYCHSSLENSRKIELRNFSQVLMFSRSSSVICALWTMSRS